MKPINSLSYTFLLLLCFQFTHAQLTPHSRIWSGSLTLSASSDNIGLVASPVLQQFLSNRFSVGGQINMWGTFQEGVQQLLIAPEIRYYLNPQRLKSNWFVLAASRFELFAQEELEGQLPFQLKAGLGLDAFLGEGLVLESKLTTAFQRQGAQSFFRYPELRMESNLVYYLSAEKRYARESISPGIGQGVWMISRTNGSVSFMALPAVRFFSIQLFPSIGYFLTDHLVGGLGIQFTYNSSKTDFSIQGQNFGSEAIIWGFTPFLRYFVGLTRSRIRPFIELNGNWVYGQNNATPFNPLPPEARIFRTAAAALSGGVDIFLSQNVALEAGLHLGKDLKTGQSQVGLDLGFEFFLSKKP